MKTITVIFFSIVLFYSTGCQSSRQMGILPPEQSDKKGAKIYLIRPKQFAGSMFATEIYLDGMLICRLGVGDYTTIKVSPGLHSIGGKYNDIWIGPTKNEYELGKEYFYKLEIYDIVSMPKEEGIQQTEKAKFFSLEK